MKYIVTDAPINHNGNIYQKNEEIDLGKEEAEKLLKKGHIKYKSQFKPIEVKGLNLG